LQSFEPGAWTAASKASQETLSKRKIIKVRRGAAAAPAAEAATPAEAAAAPNPFAGVALPAAANPFAGMALPTPAQVRDGGESLGVGEHQRYAAQHPRADSRCRCLLPAG
jgi:hypothetical protein